jgi:hypothetical protein
MYATLCWKSEAKGEREAKHRSPSTLEVSLEVSGTWRKQTREGNGGRRNVCTHASQGTGLGVGMGMFVRLHTLNLLLLP